jgi:hypothetical protein
VKNEAPGKNTQKNTKPRNQSPAPALFDILQKLDPNTTFTLKAIPDPRNEEKEHCQISWNGCHESIFRERKKVIEPLHVYQALGIVAETPKKFQFQYKGSQGILSVLSVIEKHFSTEDFKSEGDRYRNQDLASEAQRLWFREQCFAIAKELKLPPIPKKKNDTLIMKSLRFFALHVWLVECDANRTELMIEPHSPPNKAKGRARTIILNACKPVCYAPFDIGTSTRQRTCRLRIRTRENLKRPVCSSNPCAPHPVPAKKQRSDIDFWEQLGDLSPVRRESTTVSLDFDQDNLFPITCFPSSSTEPMNYRVTLILGFGF